MQSWNTASEEPMRPSKTPASWREQVGGTHASNQHFVRTDRVPRALAQIYNDLFARRPESDYVDFVRFEAAQVEPWMEDAEAFVGAISALVGHGDVSPALG